MVNTIKMSTTGSDFLALVVVFQQAVMGGLSKRKMEERGEMMTLPAQKSI